MKAIASVKGFIFKHPKVTIFILALISAIILVCTIVQIQLYGIPSQEAPLNSIEKIVVVNTTQPQMFYNIEYTINGSELIKESIPCTRNILAVPEVTINKSQKYKRPVVIYKNVTKSGWFLKEGRYLKEIGLPEDYKIKGE